MGLPGTPREWLEEPTAFGHDRTTRVKASPFEPDFLDPVLNHDRLIDAVCSQVARIQHTLACDARTRLATNTGGGFLTSRGLRALGDAEADQVEDLMLIEDLGDLIGVRHDYLTRVLTGHRWATLEQIVGIRAALALPGPISEA